MTRFLFSIFLLLTVAATSDLVSAETFRVRSQYRQDVSEPWTNETVWHFEGQVSKSLLVRMNDNPEPDFELTYSDRMRLEKVVQITSINTNQADQVVAKATENRIMLSQGFPLPFDDLDPWDLTDGKVVQKKEAGGVSFSQSFQRQTETISIKTAIAAGMLPPDLSETFDGDSLTTITIYKNGRLVVKQVWVPGEHWWRYEETPFRRSWRG